MKAKPAEPWTQDEKEQLRQLVSRNILIHSRQSRSDKPAIAQKTVGAFDRPEYALRTDAFRRISAQAVPANGLFARLVTTLERSEQSLAFGALVTVAEQGERLRTQRIQAERRRRP